MIRVNLWERERVSVANPDLFRWTTQKHNISANVKITKGRKLFLFSCKCFHFFVCFFSSLFVNKHTTNGHLTFISIQLDFLCIACVHVCVCGCSCLLFRPVVRQQKPLFYWHSIQNNNITKGNNENSSRNRIIERWIVSVCKWNREKRFDIDCWTGMWSRFTIQ